VLYHAVGVSEIELVVVERQTLGSVCANERAGVRGALNQVDSGDVELRSDSSQAEIAAPDVNDPGL
jgi:hypothetical protein